MINQKLLDVVNKYFDVLVEKGDWAIITITSFHPNQVKVEFGHKNERAIGTRTFYYEDGKVQFVTQGHPS